MSLEIGHYFSQLIKKGIGGSQIINLVALGSPKTEKFIPFKVSSYHIYTKMVKNYEYHTKNGKSHQPGGNAINFWVSIKLQLALIFSQFVCLFVYVAGWGQLCY